MKMNMMKSFSLVSILLLTSCSIESYELNSMIKYCEYQGGIYRIKMDAFYPFVTCQDGTGIHAYEIKNQ